MTYTILLGDCADELRNLNDASTDSVVTDPPYGLSKEPDIREVLTKWMAGEDYTHRGGGFMGKSWDSFVPGPAVWREVYRVLKPGGYALVFAGTRTQDLMTMALRLAGFEVRDVIEWLYFSGFPKSMDVGKSFDKMAGAERQVVGHNPGTNQDVRGNAYKSDNSDRDRLLSPITAPATPLARKWDGWRTALKPAHEPIIVVRKPLSGTVAENVEKWGTGAINVGGCMIGNEEITTNGGGGVTGVSLEWSKTNRVTQNTTHVGRFPANCVTADDDAFYSPYFNVSPPELSKKASKRDRNSDWRGEEITCAEKTTDDGRNKPIDNPFLRGKTMRVNSHPTVKPIDIMAWLVRLVTPPGGVVLDPFAGSGSTLVAAKREGFGFIGIEREVEYVEIIEARTGELRMITDEEFEALLA